MVVYTCDKELYRASIRIPNTWLYNAVFRLVPIVAYLVETAGPRIFMHAAVLYTSNLPIFSTVSVTIGCMDA